MGLWKSFLEWLAGTGQQTTSTAGALLRDRQTAPSAGRMSKVLQSQHLVPPTPESVPEAIVPPPVPASVAPAAADHRVPPSAPTASESGIAPRQTLPPKEPAVSSAARSSPSPRAISTPLVIGLDFGTHSTKIVGRVRGSQRAEVICLDEPALGYPRFAAPSLVRVVDDRVFFAREALSRDGGRLYRSLKVCLLAPSDGVGSRADSASNFNADLLVSLYLSWVLQSVRAQIQDRYGQAPVYLNMAAPMSHIEDAKLKDRYLRIINAAWESVFGCDPFPVRQGAELSLVEGRFLAWLEKTVPDRTVRRFDVLPETVAPIVSLSLDPRMAPGMYLVLDMGAGTTELSVNHVGERGADQRVACYSDESTRFGGDNFDWADKHPDGNSAAISATRKTLLCFLAKFIKRKWAEGYVKDAPSAVARQRWREITVILTGGGARRKAVEKTVNTTNPIYPWPAGETTYVVRWHRPVGIHAPGSCDLGQDASLLSVAHGLSVPRQQWPDCFPPGEMEQLPQAPPPDGPPPYWYVGH